MAVNCTLDLEKPPRHGDSRIEQSLDIDKCPYHWPYRKYEDHYKGIVAMHNDHVFH